MRVSIKVFIVLGAFAFALASYWFIGKKTQEGVFAAADQNPLVQIEDYSRGLFFSTFRFVTYGGQLRFMGKIEHGPLIFSPLKLGRGHLRLSLDPFQIVTSPIRTLVEKHPKLSKSYLDILVNLSGQYTISGNIPEMDIYIPMNEEEIVFSFSGMTLNGSGVDGRYNLSGLTKKGRLVAKQMEVNFDSIAFSASGNEIFKLIPNQWKSDFTLNSLAMSWFDDDSGHQNIGIDAIVAKFQGGVENGIVKGGSLYRSMGMVLNGKDHGSIDYSANVQGLSEKGLNNLANHISQFYDSSDNVIALNMTSSWMPIVYSVFKGTPELEIKVKSIQPSYGENEGMLKIQLRQEDHLDLPDRFMAGLSLDFDERATIQIARYFLVGTQNIQNTSTTDQEIVSSFLAELSSDIGILEKADNRYSFNASFSGKDGFIRYGKSGHTLFIDQLLDFLTPFATQ